MKTGPNEKLGRNEEGNKKARNLKRVGVEATETGYERGSEAHHCQNEGDELTQQQQVQSSQGSMASPPVGGG